MSQQVTVRFTLPEYQSFENWRKTNEGLPESAALRELLNRFFDGGYRREPTYRLTVIRNQLDQLLA